MTDLATWNWGFLILIWLQAALSRIKMTSVQSVLRICHRMVVSPSVKSILAVTVSAAVASRRGCPRTRHVLCAKQHALSLGHMMAWADAKTQSGTASSISGMSRDTVLIRRHIEGNRRGSVDVTMLSIKCAKSLCDLIEPVLP